MIIKTLLVFSFIIILLFIICYYNILIDESKDKSKGKDKMISYDIIYSIIAHENPESLHSMIYNIKKFNKDINILICLNLNNMMYKNFDINDYNYVVINTNYYDKMIHTHHIMKAHMDNYFYLCDNNINFNSIMLLASNCMFVKHMLLPQNTTVYYNVHEEETDLNSLNDWSNFTYFKENNKIINMFNDMRIQLKITTHEGALYSNILFDKICNFIIDYNIINMIEKEMCFEEIIFPSLEAYFNNGVMVKRYCKIYWMNYNFTPTIDDIKELLANNVDDFYIVKRIPRILRNKNNSLVKYINTELFGNY